MGRALVARGCLVRRDGTRWRAAPCPGRGQQRSPHAFAWRSGRVAGGDRAWVRPPLRRRARHPPAVERRVRDADVHATTRPRWWHSTWPRSTTWCPSRARGLPGHRPRGTAGRRTGTARPAAARRECVVAHGARDAAGLARGDARASAADQRPRLRPERALRGHAGRHRSRCGRLRDVRRRAAPRRFGAPHRRGQGGGLPAARARGRDRWQATSSTGPTTPGAGRRPYAARARTT